jgi:hypothetical protein
MSPAEFCRELEAYLCRKNDGHLIRIVGPVFGTVTGWAEQGIPLKVAFRGIDRYFDRVQHRPRRRPVPIQFCEADILDAFDEWRRALGLSATAARSLATPGAEVGGGSQSSGAHAVREGDASPSAAARRSDAEMDHGQDSGQASRVARDVRDGGVDAHEDVGTPSHVRRRPGLQTHIDRVMARLTQRRVDVGGATSLGAAIDTILARLDTLRADAKGLRGDARERVVATLAGLDRELLDASVASLDAAALSAVRAEAGRELEPFRSRMPPVAFARASEAATDRLVRERLRLPVIRVDE